MANDENIPLYPGFVSRSPIKGRLKRLEVGSQRLQSNLIRPTDGLYARLPRDVITTVGDNSQVLDIRHSAIAKKGSIPPSGNTSGFAYTATDNSITWYWDGTNGSHVIVIHRSDGSNFTVPTSGSGLTVSGLSASTTYYFLPFWNTNNVCNIGWVQGTTGTPQIAFVVGDTTDAVKTQQYAMQQQYQGNEALSAGFMTAATAASGGSGGGGGGGGGSPGNCVMSGTDIVPLGGLPYEIKVYRESNWVRIITESNHDLMCTLDHPLYHAARGLLPAEELTVNDIVITDEGESKIVTVNYFSKHCSKWEIRMPKGHLFWANGFLSHNKQYR